MLGNTLNRVRRAGSLSPQWRAALAQQFKQPNTPCSYLQSRRAKSSSRQQDDDKNKFDKKRSKFFFGFEAKANSHHTQNETKIKDDNIVELLELEPRVAQFVKEPESQRCGRIIDKVFGQEADGKESIDHETPPESVQADCSNSEKILNDILTTSSDLAINNNETAAFDKSVMTLQCSSNERIGNDRKDKISTEVIARDSPKSKKEGEVEEKLILRINDNQSEGLSKHTANLEEVPTVEQHVEEFNTVPKSFNQTVASEKKNEYKASNKMDYMEKTFDDLASRCFNSAPNRIDEKLIKEMNKLGKITNRFLKKTKVSSQIMKDNDENALLELKMNDWGDLKVCEYSNIRPITTGSEMCSSLLIFPYIHHNLSSVEKNRSYKYEKIPIIHEDSCYSTRVHDTDTTAPLLQTVSEDVLNVTSLTIPLQQNAHNAEVESEAKAIVSNERKLLRVQKKMGKVTPNLENVVFSIRNKVETNPSKEAHDLYTRTIEKDLEAYNIGIRTNVKKDIESKSSTLSNDKEFNIAEETRYQILTYCRSQVDRKPTYKAPVDVSDYSSLYSGIILNNEKNMKITVNKVDNDDISPQTRNTENTTNLKESDNMESISQKNLDRRDLINIVREAISKSILSKAESSTNDSINVNDIVLKEILNSTLTEKDLKDLPLSELLRRLRIANQIEGITEFIKMCETQLLESERLSRNPQLPPMTRCIKVENNKQNPPKSGTSQSPKSPENNKSASPSVKDPEPETYLDMFSSVALNQAHNNSATNPCQHLELPFNPLAAMLFGCPMPCSANVENCTSRETIFDRVRKVIVNFMEVIRLKMGSKNHDDAADYFRNNKNFEPWVPIPSWPTPQKEERQQILTPKQGCPGPVPDVENSPRRGNSQKGGNPKRSFSFPRIQF